MSNIETVSIEYISCFYFFWRLIPKRCSIQSRCVMYKLQHDSSLLLIQSFSDGDQNTCNVFFASKNNEEKTPLKAIFIK